MVHTMERSVTRALAAASVVIFALLVVIVTIQVASRQVFHAPVPWTEEAARYSFIVLVYLASALVFWERGHIAVLLVVRKLAPKPQLVMSSVIEALVFAFSAYVFILGGIRIAANAWNQGMVAIPGTVGQVYLVMPVAGALICTSAVVTVIRMWRGEIPAVPPNDEDIEV